MAVVRVVYYTDPHCPRSWAAEPALRRLEWALGEELELELVMAGLARTIESPLALMHEWLDAGAASRMPVDARLWLEGAPTSSYPACMAVKAAAEQALAPSYLRRAREAIAVERRRLDATEALVDIARRVAGLDTERFRIALGSHAIVEAFGADLDRAAAAAAAAAGAAGAGRERSAGPQVRVRTPWIELAAADGTTLGRGEPDSATAWLDAVVASGATPSPAPLPTIEQALRRFGRLATPEVAAVCGMPAAAAAAELWQRATQLTVIPDRDAGGELWSLA